jgi:hypothetical protein
MSSCEEICAAYGRRGIHVGNWLDYWLEQLVGLGVLLKVDGQAFPKCGSTIAEDAARSLFAMSKAGTKAALQVGAAHDDGLVHVSEVSVALTTDPTLFDELASPLFKLLKVENGSRIAPVRYFVRSARALGLLEFDDVTDSLDVIAHPRLPSVNAGTPDTTVPSDTDNATTSDQAPAEQASSHVTAVQTSSDSAATVSTASPVDDTAHQN